MRRRPWILPALVCLICMACGIILLFGIHTGVTVTFLDVGKADCIIIQNGGRAYMIDTATDDRADDILDFLDDEDIDAIDILFLTHYDKDHIGGAAEILEAIPVGRVYTTAYAAKVSDEIDELQDALDNAGLPAEAVSEDTVLTFGRLAFTLYPPADDSYESNDSSLVIRMTYGDTAMLFAGDIESDRINALVTSDEELDAQLLKVPHHGIYNDETETLIAAVMPDYAVITSSKSDKEDDETVDELEDAGAEVYLTRKGTVTAYTNGRSISIKQD